MNLRNDKPTVRHDKILQRCDLKFHKNIFCNDLHLFSAKSSSKLMLKYWLFFDITYIHTCLIYGILVQLRYEYTYHICVWRRCNKVLTGIVFHILVANSHVNKKHGYDLSIHYDFVREILIESNLAIQHRFRTLTTQYGTFELLWTTALLRMLTDVILFGWRLSGFPSTT